MGYGWDFCPRMVHQGSGGPSHRGGRSAAARPARRRATLSDGTRRAGLVRPDVAPPHPAVCTSTVRDPSGAIVAEGAPPRRRAEPRTARRPRTPPVVAERPRRPAAVRVTVELRDGDRETVGRAERPLRFPPDRPAPEPRRARRRPSLHPGGQRPPLYAKGWNWVPHDALYGAARPGRLQHLLTLAAAAHVTLLRVWGGGLIESEEFYAACDRLGLLVWQEFSLSSSGIDSVPSEDPVYLAHMEDEARHCSRAAPPPRARAVGTRQRTPRHRRRPPAVAGRLRRDRGARPRVAELDPGRAWLPGSPSGRAFLNRLDVIHADPDGQHDVHGPWEHQGPARTRSSTTPDLSAALEFGVEGMANRRTWNAVVPEDRQWPTGRDNPVMEHLGAWWNNTPLVGRFRRPARGRRRMSRASQHLQYDGLRYAVEANLRRAPRSRVPAMAVQRALPQRLVHRRRRPPRRPQTRLLRSAPRLPARPRVRPFATQVWGGRPACSPPPPPCLAPPSAGLHRHRIPRDSPGPRRHPGRGDDPRRQRHAQPSRSPTSPARCSYSTWNYATTTERCSPPTASAQHHRRPGPADRPRTGPDRRRHRTRPRRRATTHTGGPAALGLCLTDARPIPPAAGPPRTTHGRPGCPAKASASPSPGATPPPKAVPCSSKAGTPMPASSTEPTAPPPPLRTGPTSRNSPCATRPKAQ